MAEALYHFEGNRRAPAKPKVGAHLDPEPYEPNQEVKNAVNLAIYLQRPLLLEGEAGSGKSRLAYAIAYELGLPLYVWSVRSTSQAHEGLYTFDALLRLHDVQTRRFFMRTPGRDPGEPTWYRTLGALGKAFKLEGYPAVVLIDEIDKADLDFPNDLLTVLEPPRRFEIPETRENIVADVPPIVIITSNKEKGNLPAPFLRRCIYSYLRFPDDADVLRGIIDLHLKERRNRSIQPNEEPLIDKAISLFQKIRQSGMTKAPGTSELLDWVYALLAFDYPAENIPEEVNDKIPYREALYKLRDDVRRLATDAK